MEFFIKEGDKLIPATDKVAAITQSAVDIEHKKMEREIQDYRAKLPEFLQTHGKAKLHELEDQAAHVVKFIEAALVTQSKDARLKQFEALTKERPEYYKQAAFSEASNGAGQLTVPTFWQDKIWNTVEQFGFAIRMADVQPMGAKTINLTTGGGVTVSWPGDNTAPTAFDATNFFSQTPLTASTMAAAQIIQKELLQDTAVPILNYLSRQVGIAVAKEQDLQFFNGTGSPFTGFIGTSGVNSVYQGGSAGSGKNTFASISWVDLVSLSNAVNTTMQEGGAFVMSQTVYSALRKEASSSRPIYAFNEPSSIAGEVGISPITGNQIRLPRQVNLWQPLGFPCYVVGNSILPTTAANTASVLFMNWTNGIVGVRQELLMETYDQAYGGVDLSGQRQIALASYGRYSFGFPIPAAGAILKTSVS